MSLPSLAFLPANVARLPLRHATRPHLTRLRRPLRHVNLPNQPRPPLHPHPHPPLRQTPRAHSHCGHAHAHPPSTASSTTATPLQTLHTTLTTLRQNLFPPILGSILLLLAALLHLSTPLTLLSRLFLHTSLLLTGILPLLATTLTLIRFRLRSVNVDTLMTLAALVSVLTGAVFEGALLAALYSVSHAAEHAVQLRATKALNSLRDAAPQFAYTLTNPRDTSSAKKVPVHQVRIGNYLLVKAGQLLPCDGVIAHGSAFVSVKFLTGEATPRSVGLGEHVPAGARAEDAPIIVRVTQIGAESSLARIARLVTSAQENRPVITKFFDRFGTLYARSVLLVSACIAAFLPGITAAFAPFVKPVAFAGRAGSLSRGLGFLVAASPCALLIGAPVAYLAALSSCARKGVLTKSGAKSLEAASRATHVVFDKTGTLTTGKLSLTSATMLPNDEESEGAWYRSSSTGNGVASVGLARGRMMLESLKELGHAELSRVVAAAAALERGAVHPIATAVQKRADQLGGPLPMVTEPKVIAGQGVEGVLSFDDVDGNMEIASGRFGRPSYILGKGSVEYVRRMTAEASSLGETVSVLEIGGDRYLLRLKDELRPESARVVAELKKQGLKISVLTGDGEGAAQFVSGAIGGGVRVVSNATPEQKLTYVTDLGQELDKKKNGVVMVGDGVNDAAALAASLVGVACGLSSATAVHAADVVLVREDLQNVGWFLKKARATKAIVRQNLIIALGLMVIATGACVAGAVPLWLAVTLHEGGTILVGLNGLRLLRER